MKPGKPVVIPNRSGCVRYERPVSKNSEKRAGNGLDKLGEALAAWTNHVLLPSRLLEVSIPEVRTLGQSDAVLETNRPTWTEQVRALGRAEGRIRLLLRQGLHRIGES